MTIISQSKLVPAAAILSEILMLAGCGKQTPATAPQSTPPEVGIITVKPERAVLTTELSGWVSPHLIAEVRPQVGSIIQQRHFTEGTDIKAGQILYQIDPATFRATFASAKATLSRAEANLAPAPASGRSASGTWSRSRRSVSRSMTMPMRRWRRPASTWTIPV